MDILIVKLSLLILGPLIIAGCLIYSVSIIREVGALAYFRQIIKLGKVVIAGIGTLLVSLVGLLASSSKASGISSASENAARGGVLNYRTGEFDDGTDATGWYEQD